MNKVTSVTLNFRAPCREGRSLFYELPPPGHYGFRSALTPAKIAERHGENRLALYERIFPFFFFSHFPACRAVARKDGARRAVEVRKIIINP